MNLNISLLSMASSLASYAYSRHALVADNIANADTPGYKARDLPDFSRIAGDRLDPGTLLSTRPGHIGAGDATAEFVPVAKSAFGSASPNGNTVSLEDQMIRSAEVQQQHELALGVYTKSLNILRLSLGRK